MADFEESMKEAAELVKKGEYTEEQPYFMEYEYHATDIYKGMIQWELSCALILKDWKRVRNALLMLESRPPLIRRRRRKNGEKEGNTGIHN